MLNQQSRLFAGAAALASTIAAIGAPHLPTPTAAPIAIVSSTTFQSRISRYMTLRRTIVADVLRRAPGGNEGDASVRAAVALAIQQARQHAAAGDIIGGDADRILAAVRIDMARRNADERREVMAEVPSHDQVRVNERYPEGEPLATMSPLLLQQLEPLPPALQYRLLGTSLILLDIDTGVIVDVVPHVVDGTT